MISSLFHRGDTTLAAIRRMSCMKKRWVALVCSLSCITYLNTALAADSMDLVVQVTAVTGSCTPTLDTSVINFGVIKYTSLNESTSTLLPQKNVQLTINCSSPMAVGWTISDNRSESVARLPVTLLGRVYEGASLGGLGKTSKGNAIGNWAISTGLSGSVQYDGVDGTAITSTDQGVTWHGSSNTPVSLDFAGGVITTIAESTSTEPMPFSTGTFSLGIGALIAPQSSLNLTDDATLDGSATISLVYL